MTLWETEYSPKEKKHNILHHVDKEESQIDHDGGSLLEEEPMVVPVSSNTAPEMQEWTENYEEYEEKKKVIRGKIEDLEMIDFVYTGVFYM